eukprot:5844609-Pyramimonas_sp.AAC.1
MTLDPRPHPTKHLDVCRKVVNVVELRGTAVAVVGLEFFVAPVPARHVRPQCVLLKYGLVPPPILLMSPRPRRSSEDCTPPKKTSPRGPKRPQKCPKK